MIDFQALSVTGNCLSHFEVVCAHLAPTRRSHLHEGGSGRPMSNSARTWRGYLPPHIPTIAVKMAVSTLRMATQIRATGLTCVVKAARAAEKSAVREVF
jgi:hypothetical protein